MKMTVDDLWALDLFLLAFYGLYALLFGMLVYVGVRATQAFRGRVSWPKARVMGVPFAVFIWIQAIFYLLLIDSAYSLIGLILRTPLWLDFAISLSVIALAWVIFWRLMKRPTFKPKLFIPLVLVPLGIPGMHFIGHLAQAGAIEVSQRGGIAFVKYGHPLDGLSIRNVDTAVDALPVVRLFPQTGATVAGKVTFRNSLQKGTFGDFLTAKRLTSFGYKKLPSKYNGFNGIDGIFIKRDLTGNVTRSIPSFQASVLDATSSCCDGI